MARPTKYGNDILDLAKTYVDQCQDVEENVVSQESEKYTMYKQKLTVNLPSIEGMCAFIGISKDTCYAWEKEHPEFSDVINVLRLIQAERLINKGLSGDYNAYIAKALLAKHGYIDKSEVDQNLKIEWAEERTYNK